MENCHSCTSILQLPDDSLFFIFEKLSSSSDRESFGLTCHRWLHIQNSSRQSLQFECSFTHLQLASLSHPSTDINTFHLYRMLNRFQQLQSLSLSGCTQLPDSGLSILLNYGLKLQKLCLDCCFGVTDNGLFFVARGCPSLRIISLYLCNVTDVGLETLSIFCASLQDVNLAHCSLITDNGVRSLFQNCCQLRAINISQCRSINGVGFQGCSHTLAYLEASSCKLEPEGILSIVGGGGLEYLNISNLSWSIHGHGVAAIDVGFISKLRVIDFRMCRTISDDAVMKIAQGCPLLQEWNLALCHEIKMPGWASISSNCHNLERLHVNRCRNLCDQGLRALRDGCRRLQKLHLGRCRQISWSAIEMFKCVRNNVQITDDEIMCVAPTWAFQL